MNVLLIGEQAAGARVLQSLAESGARIVAVMSSRPGERAGLSFGIWRASLDMRPGRRNWSKSRASPHRCARPAWT